MRPAPPPTARQLKTPFIKRTRGRQAVQPQHRAPILAVGETCWKIAQGRRVKVLVDAAEYFTVLRQALLRARRSVYILGWDIDSRVDLAPGGAEDGEPTKLRALLCRLVERNPELRVNLLLWDYSTLYAFDREPLPRVSLGWQTPDQIEICLDDQLPLGACHHQKVVVIDDTLAFCGGIDLCCGRWDTKEHMATEPSRTHPEGHEYGPFHDVQMMTDGEAAAVLAELVHSRWSEAACRPQTPIRPVGDPWPEGVAPDFTDVEVGIARTLPPLYERPEAREIETLYCRSIAQAERLIYIENQYVTAGRVADALAHRLAQKPDLEVILLSPQSPTGWMAAKAMGAGRWRFMKRLADAGVDKQVHFVHPTVAGADGAVVNIFVHSKVLIVDDRFFTIGSANLNNRSMGFDTECNLAIEATDEQPELRDAIRHLRNRLLGEHLGLAPDAVERELQETGSARGLIEAERKTERRLDWLDTSHDEEDDDLISVAVVPIADPERPIEADQLLLDLFGGISRHAVWPWIKKGAIVAAAVLVLVGLWRWTPLSQLADLDTLRPMVETLRANGIAPVAIPVLFVVASLVLFPVTLLVTLTAIVFDPFVAFAYAFVGTVVSAATAYGIGFKAGRSFLRRLLGKRLNAVNRAISNRGVIAVMILRVAPVAPFTVVNMVCGAARIRFFDYMVGTILGMAPGIAVLTALGTSLTHLLSDPSPEVIAMAVGAVATWIVLGLGLQRLLRKWRRRRRVQEAAS